MPWDREFDGVRLEATRGGALRLSWNGDPPAIEIDSIHLQAAAVDRTARVLILAADAARDVVCGNGAVWACAYDRGSDDVIAMCVDARTGRRRWTTDGIGLVTLGSLRRLDMRIVQRGESVFVVSCDPYGKRADYIRVIDGRSGSIVETVINRACPRGKPPFAGNALR